MRLLLLSNSTNPGEEFLGYPKENIREFLGELKQIVFVPYAGVTITWDDYVSRVRGALGPIGLDIQSVHEVENPGALVNKAEAIMVGGGNTFHLLKHLYANDLVERIRGRVESGTPYIGWSAGSNVACPTIRTTNDMPIVEPPTLNAFNLVPFQLNPHYTDASIPNLRAETRDDRLNEFCIANPSTYVAGLREGTMLRVENSSITLIGDRRAKIFKHGEEPRELTATDSLQFLLNSQPPT